MILITLLGFAPCVAGTAHGNFSGTWTMDPARSESAHQDVPIGLSTLVIRMTKNQVTIETTRNGDGKAPEFHETLSFKLDGTETTNTGQGGVRVTGRARWDGPKLVIETARNVQAATVTTLYVHTLSADGREMTVDKTLTVQHGYQGTHAANSGHGKDVYVRVSK